MARPDGYEVHRLVRFAGRTAELDQLGDILAGDGPAVVLVRGDSGVGKTAVVGEALKRWLAGGDDRAVCRTRAFRRGGIPRRAIADIAAQVVQLWRSLPEPLGRAIVPADVALMRRLVPWLARVPVVADAAADDGPRDPLEVRSRAFEAARQLVAGLARERRIVMLVEDAHWLDGTTASLLGYALAEPAAPAVTLVCTADGHALPPPVARLSARSSRAHTIDVRPLPADAAAQLAGDLLGGEGQLAARIAEATAGVPVDIEAYAAAGADPLPPSPAAAWVACAGALPDGQRALLELCAIGEQPLDVALASEVLEVGVDAIEVAAAGLRAARLCERDDHTGERRIALRHRTIGAAIAGALDPARASALHRGLAVALEMRGRSDSARVARHFRDAGDVTRAAEIARRAGEAADRELDFDRAALLYALARGDARDRALSLAEADALAHAGQPHRAAERFTAAAEPGDRLELYARAAEELVRGGYLEEGTRALGDALAEIDVRLARSPAAALRATLVRRARLRVRGLGFRPRAAGEIPAAELAAIDALAAATMSLAVVDNARAADLQSRHVLRALAAGEPERLARALALEGGFRASLGQVQRTRAIAHVTHQLRKEHGAGEGLYDLWALGAIHYFLESSWREAVDKFDRVEAAIRAAPRAQGWILDGVEMYGCLARLYLGAIPELIERVPRYLREAELRGDVYAAVNLRSRLNLMWLAVGELDRARADLDEVERTWLAAADSYPVQRYWALHSHAELALYQGDALAARARLSVELPALRRSLLVRVPMVRVELEHLQARVALAIAAAGEAEGADRRALITRALAHARSLEHERPPVAGMFALLVRAAASRLEGRGDDARTYLGRAGRWLERTETGLYAAAARYAARATRADGEAAMAAVGVVDAERMTATLLPGLAGL